MSDEFTTENNDAPVEETMVLPEVVPASKGVTADAEPPLPAADAPATDAAPAAPVPATDAASVLSGPGPMVTSGSRVVLIVSSGPAEVVPTVFVEMPDMMGQRQGDALSMIQDAGLSVRVFNDYSLTVEKGRVMAQRPTLGANVPAGSEVVLLVSSGAVASQTHSVALPRLAGLSEGEAVTKLQAAGLSPQVVRAADALIPDGVVIAQLPDEISLAALPTKRRASNWIWVVTAIVMLAAVAAAFFYYQSQPIVVPNVVGLTQVQAEQTITSAGFKVGSIVPTQTISAAEIGTVVTQTPVPDTQGKKGSEIIISVSGGQALLVVPDVTGKVQADAEKTLKDAGFRVTVQQGFDATVTAGSVILQSPAASEKVPVNTTIGIVVSKGAENVIVPGVVGQAQTSATAALTAVGLSALPVLATSDSVSKGVVINQAPQAGTSIAPKSIVGLLISDGSLSSTATSATVPAVAGMSLVDAQKALKKKRLVGVVVPRSGTGETSNTVVAQMPDAGTVVRRNASVMLIVSNGK